jgi:arylsulfatase A-like enzyme
MTDLGKNSEMQRPSIKVGGTRAWITFTLLSSLFTLPASASPRTTEESASSSGRRSEGEAFKRNRAERDRQPQGCPEGVRLAGSINASSTKPNIITIITDDQGWADIGYNNPKVYTPNLDALAAESALCTRHYSMPQCTPTRIAAFTGRYPGRFGNAGLTANMEPVFPHGTFNLATFLKVNGYKTYLSGKWHMGGTEPHGPHHHGFDSTYGSYAGAIGYYDHRYRPKHKDEITWNRDGKIIEGYENGQHVTDLVTDEAVRIIEENQESDQPFFLYLAYHAPHTPLDERGEFIDTPTQLDPENPTRWLNEDKIKWFHDPKGIIQSEPDPEKRLLLAVIHHLDHGIGQVIKALDASGQRDNTLILFSSDNGPQVNWPGNAYPDDLKLTDFNQEIPFRGKKCDTYEGGIRVPGLVHWRGKIPARKIDSPVHVVDWLPTIAGFIGTEALVSEDQPALDGQNNAAIFLTKADPSTRLIYQLWGRPPNRRALTLGPWKIVHYGKKEPKESDWELYDLGKDARESKNLAKKHPDKIKQLHQLFVTERAKDRKTKSNL